MMIVLIENQEDMMRCDVAHERPWPRVEARSSQMTWPSIEASRLGRRKLNMHAQATCVTEQAWIQNNLCSVGER